MAGNAEQTRRVALQELAASALKGKAYWRSLGDYADTPEFRRWAQDEFPQMAEELEKRPGGTSRRSFLQIMGASLALAGLGVSGCRRPEEKIRPYTAKPVNTVMGKGMYYATTFVMAGKAMGVLAETHEGRPTKIEGNPNHPNSLGATDLFAQASVLDLYDPDRSRNFLKSGKPATREDFLAFLKTLAPELRASKGKGFAILSEDYASPVMAGLIASARRSMPELAWFVHEPLISEPELQRPTYDIAKADVIVCLDCDLLGIEDDGCRNRLAFAAGRQVDATHKMNRLYVVEPAPTTTGASADHRLRLPASQVGPFAESLLKTLEGTAPSGPLAKWINAIAEELKSAGKRGLVAIGSRQWGQVQFTAAEINRAIGSEAVRYQAVFDDGSDGGAVSRGATPIAEGLEDFIGRMQGNGVQTLLVLGGNPAYTASGSGFLEAARNVRTVVRLGLYEDETSELATWHVPAAHYLESWDLAVDSSGVLSPVQPMIEPLFGSMSAVECLARVLGNTQPDIYELVRGRFTALTGDNSDAAWHRFLQQGVAAKALELNPVGWPLFKDRIELPAPTRDAIEIVFAADPSVLDGRFANNGWLQELPDPITKLTWDNAALLSPTTAKALEVTTGDVLKLEVAGKSLQAPAFILPGCADFSITLPLGYGRRKGGSLCENAGFDAYALYNSAGGRFLAGAKVTRTGKTYPLATTQEHWAIDLAKHFPSVADEQARERAIIREGSAEKYSADPAFARKEGEHAPIHLNVYSSPRLDGANQWGMTVDLSACVGCNACVIACQAENNIPIVGKDEVIRGREMHWMRLDRYFTGEDENSAGIAVQPMLCQHCEAAPCEPVCPVNATVHSPEGLNEMVYNRCIGTRYCSNNCPYKVRRFNFYDWNKGTIREDTAPTRDGQIQPVPTRGFSRPQVMQPPMQETLKMQKNPNVTVRIRGVMEKCTYCVQRIEMAKIEMRSKVGQGSANAEVNGKPAVKVPDGMIQTACQQVCPTKAIVFGDTSDPQSQVSKARQSPRSYQVLEHLNVKPRTQYLARIKNTNPKLA